MMKRLFTFPAMAVVAVIVSSCARKNAPHDPMERWAWEVPSPPPPPMAWVPAGPFRKADRTPDNVTAIVIHTTEGRWSDDLTHAENQERNFRNVINYFKKNDRNVSAHYIIGRNGEICQMVNEGDVAHTQTYYNGRAFGIECAGWSRRPETWTPELMESLIKLCAYLCVKWDIPAYHPEGTAYEGPYSVIVDEENKRFTGPGLVGHDQVQPWNKSDPGDHFPWEEFSERVRLRIREYGVEPIELPSVEEIVSSDIFATARIREERIGTGEPFTYELTLRGPGVNSVSIGDIVFPDFSVIEGLEVVSKPVRETISETLVQFEIGLRRDVPGRFSIGASRISIDGSWNDTQTLRVNVE